MDRKPPDSAGSSVGVGGARSRRASLRRAAACFLAIAGAPLFLQNAGGAAEPSRQGWWWQANPGQGAPAPPAPPDVPTDGLYVQGGPSGPSAIAAVLFQLGDGEKPKSLTLHLVQPQAAVQSSSPAPIPGTDPSSAPASSPAPPPALQACPIQSGSFNADQGGPMSDAPTADCATPMPAQVDAAAGTATFDLSSLVAASDTVALAILPAGPTDRAAIQHPGADAFAVDMTSSSSEATTTASDTSTAADFSSTSAPAATGDLSTSSGSLDYVPGAASTAADVTAPATAMAPAPITAAAPAPAAQPVARHVVRRPAVLASSRSSTATHLGQLAALGLVVAALLSYSRGYGLLGGKFAED